METRMLHSIEETAAFAGDLLSTLSPREDGKATLIALSGDLGAGKTAFVKSLAEHLRIKEHITSPTFVIMKKYPIKEGLFAELVHIDAYRMQSEHELLTLGWSEVLSDSKNLIALEWPERVSGIVPAHAIRLTFDHVDENSRSVTRHPYE